MIDRIGQKYGMLTIIRLATKEERAGRKKVHYQVQCDCGQYKIVSIDDLRSGNTKSCGCLKKNQHPHNFIDLTGQSFGEWKVLKYAGNQGANNKPYWQCECSCGTIRDVCGDNLRNNISTSCGCSRNVVSKGEQTIAKLLKEAGIPFVSQYYLNINDHRHYFDFFVNDSYFIEFDGEQHHRSVEFFGGEEGLLFRQKRDAEKNEYCQKNNIPIIRIDYSQLKNLTIKDIILKESREDEN